MRPLVLEPLLDGVAGEDVAAQKELVVLLEVVERVLECVVRNANAAKPSNTKVPAPKFNVLELRIGMPSNTKTLP